MNAALIVIFTSLFVFTARAESAPEGVALVKSVMKRYQEASAVEAKLKKHVTMALLDEKTEAEGRLWMSKGQLRLETDKPQESLIVIAKNFIWVVTPTPKELGGRPQVLKIRSKETKQQAKAPLATLLGKASAWDEFKVTKQKRDGNEVSLELVPKKAGSLGEVVLVNLKIDTQEKRLNEFAYKDDLDNETRFAFLKTDFSVKADPAKFKYTPPKNAEITEY